MTDQTPQPAQPKDKPLSNKEQAFVEQYVTCWNGAEAARRAGYAEASARVQASRLLAKDNISRAIKARVSELAMSADEVLLRLAEIARATMADFVDDNGKLAIKEAKKNGKLHLVRRYSQSAKFGDEIELLDQMKALELLGKNNGALGELKDSLLKNLDLDKLTPHQLRLIAAGEDILTVLLNPQGGA